MKLEVIREVDTTPKRSPSPSGGKPPIGDAHKQVNRRFSFDEQTLNVLDELRGEESRSGYLRSLVWRRRLEVLNGE